jgi:hypothetical protein
MHIWFNSDNEDERIVDQPEDESGAITKTDVTGRRMGPCYNCATTDSPQWRRGPAEKPVLCNACGLRYGRTGSELPKLKREPEAAAVLLQLSTAVLSDAVTAVPPKRPRGRPRKIKLPAAVLSDDTTDVLPIKRRPGRPRKVQPAAVQAVVHVKRARGRPRKKPLGASERR